MKALYTIIGIVKKGAQRGREFGYPTANVSLQKNTPQGVYAAVVEINNKSYKASTFIGAAVTYGDEEYKSESYILDFDEDIYGQTIKILLYKKIRGSEKFVSEEKLIEQIRIDVLQTRSFFRDNS